MDALNGLPDAVQQGLALWRILALRAVVHIRQSLDVRFEILLVDWTLEDRASVSRKSSIFKM